MTKQLDDWDSISLSLLKDPHDFQKWQSLVHFAESQSGLINKTLNHVEIQNLRKSYEAILEKYPFLLKYWISYALWERKLDHNDKAELIFTRALQVGGHDVTLWVTYLKFKIETLTNDIHQLLELFETARLKIGFHYQSFEFYELYLKFLDTYADKTNNFRKKYILLLRVMLEIPFYNYAAAFELIMEFISPSNSTIEDLSLFMHSSNLKDLKNQFQNNKKLILEAIQKVLADAYVVNQAKSYELFAYERLITGGLNIHKLGPVSLNQLENWDNYLNFVELTYPSDYVSQLYERSLLDTGNDPNIVMKFVTFCIHAGKINKARNILRKALPKTERNVSVKLLVRLCDLEIATGNILMAKDMISRYILVNTSVSNCIFEKLMQIEALISLNDEEYLCNLAYEIMLATNSPVFFEKLLNFPISKSAIKSFFLRFVKEELKETYGKLAASMDIKNYDFFWKELKKIANDADLEGVQLPLEYK